VTQRFSPITFGKQLRKFEVGGFVLTETIHPPCLVLSRHDHECANINLTLQGSFREIIGNHWQESSQSTLLVKPAGEHHANQYGSAGAHGFIIEVQPSKLESIRRFSKLFDAPSYIQGGRLPVFMKKIYKEFQAIGSVASELMIEGLVLEMLAETSRHIDKTYSSLGIPHRIREARDFIHENFTEGISLSTIATAVGLNPAYLARMFRKYYGCSVGEYVKRLQLEFAEQELIKSESSLAEIAAAAGFYDQSHFTNAFKLYAKMTPTEFRAITQTGKADTNRS
jgi:AraC family transcriptional regulator